MLARDSSKISEYERYLLVQPVVNSKQPEKQRRVLIVAGIFLNISLANKLLTRNDLMESLIHAALRFCEFTYANSGQYKTIYCRNGVPDFDLSRTLLTENFYMDDYWDSFTTPGSAKQKLQDFVTLLTSERVKSI